MQSVSREDFVKFIRQNPGLTDKPIEGKTLAAMQYFDADGQLVAQAMYSKPVQAQNIKVIPQYLIKE